MEVRLVTTQFHEIDADALVVPVFEGETPDSEWLKEKQPHLSTGPTGIGVRTLVRLAQMLAR